jgi:ribbon-helix-helix CopG family protein
VNRTSGTKRSESAGSPARAGEADIGGSNPPGATPIHIDRADGVYNGSMRRIQIHIDEALDDAAEVEAARRGLSKAALIRASLARELATETRRDADPWLALTGWLDDGAVEDLDAVIYDKDR